MLPPFEIVWPAYILAAIMIGAVFADKVLRRIKRRRVRRFDFPLAWIKILEKNVPLYNRLPLDMREELQDLIRAFVGDKVFKACGDLDEVTEEMEITIAGQACILLLNRKNDVYYTVRSVLIYPSTYIDKQSDEQVARLGESWASGSVVLAWDAVKRSARDVKDGKNLVIHEFAHQLDQADGAADGVPPLEKAYQYVGWAKVLGDEYTKLVASVESGKKTFLDDYGAEHPAEFFAVASEFFFERPKALLKRHKDLYEQLRIYYKVDPARW